MLKADGRPALVRRHRHLRQGGGADQSRCRRPGQRRGARQRRRAARQGDRRRRQSRRDPARPHRICAGAAGASTPTPSTIPPASTPPTTKSISRSCSAGRMRRGELNPADARRAAGRDDRRGRRASCWPTITTRPWRCRWRNRAAAQGPRRPGRFMRDLEARGRLDRAVEFLPDDAELQQAARTTGKGLTRPELAVLLAYAKLDLEAEIDRQRAAGRSGISAPTLAGYFPPARRREVRRRTRTQHRLKREIVSTVIANRVVNLAGPVFVARMKEMSGAPAARVARAFVVAEGAFGLEALKARIDALDGSIDADDRRSACIPTSRKSCAGSGCGSSPTCRPRPISARRSRSIAPAWKPARHVLDPDFALRGAGTESAHRRACGAPARPLDVAEDVARPAADGRLRRRSRCWPARAALDLDLVAGAYFAMGAEVGTRPAARRWRARISGGGALGPPRHPADRRRSLRRPARADGRSAARDVAREGQDPARRRRRGGKAMGAGQRPTRSPAPNPSSKRWNAAATCRWQN